MSDSLTQLVSNAQQEVERQMGICNSCRYCEGICAVFPAMELRRTFTPGDVDYLSNLCHNCSACYYEFEVNVPSAMSELREETYSRYAWPSFASGFFDRNGLWVTISTAISVALFILGFVLLSNPEALFAANAEPGAFYRVMPHNTMVLVFGSVFLFSILSIAISIRRFWRAAGPVEGLTFTSFWQAMKDSTTLRYLDGGGMGCMNEDEKPTNSRRFYHHLTFYGFMLCFASTTSGTVFHYLGWEAPYPWWSPTVILGTLGGVGLLIGPWGLLQARKRQEQALKSSVENGMAVAFLWMLFLVSITGLALLVLRSTSMMGILLAIHLGFVFGLFLSFPYGKFVHGFYRYTALVRHAHEQRLAHGEIKPTKTTEMKESS